jgi:hypothetical protein
LSAQLATPTLELCTTLPTADVRLGSARPPHITTHTVQWKILSLRCLCAYSYDFARLFHGTNFRRPLLGGCNVPHQSTIAIHNFAKSISENDLLTGFGGYHWVLIRPGFGRPGFPFAYSSANANSLAQITYGKACMCKIGKILAFNGCNG